jgi:hypothetical protein
MLTLLLDEHMSPIIANQVVAKDDTVRIIGIHRWHEGEYLHTEDELILEAAYREQTTLVTFDQSTIRPVLKEWGEQGRSHGGVIFIDEKSISQNDYGGLVKALLSVWRQMQEADFIDVVLFLQPVRQHNS